MSKVLYSIYLYCALLVLWLVNFPIFTFLWLISRPFDKRSHFIHYITAIWGRMHFIFMPTVRVKLYNKHKLLRNEPCIYIVNHMSMFDIVTTFCIYHDVKWVSKKENFQAPILGWVMKMNKYICIDRNDPKRLAKMMADCKQALSAGEHLLIFPEGTRSKTGKLSSFKDGAFLVAIENKVPIVPVVMDGTQHVLPKNGFWMKPDRIKVPIKVLDPVRYEQFGTDDPKILKEKFFKIMENELEILRTEKK